MHLGPKSVGWMELSSLSLALCRVAYSVIVSSRKLAHAPNYTVTVQFSISTVLRLDADLLIFFANVGRLTILCKLVACYSRLLHKSAMYALTVLYIPRHLPTGQYSTDSRIVDGGIFPWTVPRADLARPRSLVGPTKTCQATPFTVKSPYRVGGSCCTEYFKFDQCQVMTSMVPNPNSPKLGSNEE